MKRSILLLVIGVLFLLGLVSCSLPGGAPVPVTISEEPGIDCAPVTPADGAEMILIPGGTFKMGSVETNDAAQPDEMPEHDVLLSCYSIYKEEVTNSMYDKCVQAGECFPVVSLPDSMTERYEDPAYADHPVIGVDYNMATEYCHWISGRLPTEAEWEFAATSTEEFIFPWGNEDADCDKANFAGCLDPAEPVLPGTLTDGESPFKVQDMAGNAWEWVFDWYDAEYYSISPTSAPTGPLTGEQKVVRGGAYNSDLHMLLAANRHAGNPYRAYSNVGFRCVIGAIEIPAEQEVPIPELHEVPNDDVPVDDPGDPKFVVLSVHPLDCPDGMGNLHVVMDLSSTDPFTIDGVFLDSDAYTCDPYDDVAKQLHCYGPAPAPNANPNYLLDVHLDVQGWGAVDFNCIGLPKPADCDDQQTPTKFNAIAGCPVAGIVPVTLDFNPAIVWTSTNNSYDEPLNCVMNTPNQMTCLATPAELLNMGLYILHLQGMYDGDNYGWNPIIMPPDCPAEQEPGEEAFFFAWCPDGPALDVLFSPTDAVLGPVTLGANDLMCVELEPGHAQCNIPDGQEGLSLEASVCVDGNCFTGTRDIPVCSNIQQYAFRVDTYCANGVAGVHVLIAPAPPSPMTDIYANGTKLDCTEVDVFEWMCTGLPGSPGDTLDISIEYVSSAPDHASVVFPTCNQGTGEFEYYTLLDCAPGKDYYFFYSQSTPAQGTSSITQEGTLIDCFHQDLAAWSNDQCNGIYGTPGDSTSIEVCYANGDCFTNDYVYPTCGPAESPCTCKILDVSCVNENTISVNVQTCKEAPKALQAGSVSADDTVTNYACSLLPGIGQVYCAGPHPIVPAGLTLYYQYVGDLNSYYCWMPEWPAQIIGCQQPDEEEPQIDCSLYTSPITCPITYCNWVYSPVGGGGSCKPK